MSLDQPDEAEYHAQILALSDEDADRLTLYRIDEFKGRLGPKPRCASICAICQEIPFASYQLI